ncbi:MAG: hypothetical protein CMP59_05615 [Flavobacteriales bacterium]|nr:hypothetical protein [Flavobacteriales bacterium]|tara:strand:+ start:89 stop:1354 length:1266 start_codon:yes stop_codon:yes gene_type:complete
MRTILHLARLIVGNLFIFSGLVKLNDPLGFSYKLEEYFIEFGMDWGWLHEILVPLAAALCIFEIVLGIAVLVGYKFKNASWLLLLMIIFFTILTFASAVFEIVRSCGCFGDAIPLTPWESFYKDLILLVLILLLFFKRNEIIPFPDRNFDTIYFVISAIAMVFLSIQLEWWMPFYFTVGVLAINLILKFSRANKLGAPISTISSALLSLIIGIWAVEHLPFKDFRPYAVGKNIPEQMTLPPNAKPPVYENILTYKNTETGEVVEMNMQEYTASKIWEDKDWEWVSTDNTLIDEGDVAPITDFSIVAHGGGEMTDIFMSQERLVLIVAYDLSAADNSAWDKIREFAIKGSEQDVITIGLSAASREEKDKLIAEYNLPLEFYVTDGIVLKTIVRSNPGIVYLERGTVKGKWHLNDMPDVNQLR